MTWLYGIVLILGVFVNNISTEELHFKVPGAEF